ncbi:MAG: D-alanyl-D-alanine carboxypeptidase, partial [Alphaproteobacteria bacterium]|nr:D-alanyl-D-alanine carboxypeptidase [Alphaproteobacteria bacterium]
GLPSPDHKMSFEDLSKLAQSIIRDFPEFYPIFSQKSFTYHNITQGNRNPLLYSMSDADGLKTGHTEEAGFGLTASAKRGNRRIIGVMNGMTSNKERSEEAEKLMNWAFREFDNYKVFKQYERVVAVPVYMGVEDEIDLVAGNEEIFTLPRNEAKSAKLTAVYKKPIKAPIVQGEKLGEVRLEVEGNSPRIIPLYADHSVEKRGFGGRILANLSRLLFGGK